MSLRATGRSPSPPPPAHNSAGSSGVFILGRGAAAASRQSSVLGESVAGCLGQPGPCSRAQKPRRVSTEESLRTVDNEVSEPPRSQDEALGIREEAAAGSRPHPRPRQQRGRRGSAHGESSGPGAAASPPESGCQPGWRRKLVLCEPEVTAACGTQCSRQVREHARVTVTATGRRRGRATRRLLRLSCRQRPIPRAAYGIGVGGGELGT